MIFNTKGLSSIFSTLIVIAITLSLIPPLMIYYNQFHNSSVNLSQKNYTQDEVIIHTKLNTIYLGNDPYHIFIYNYGNYPINITKIYLNSKSFPVSLSIGPDRMIRLSSVVPENQTVTTLGICANGYLFVFSSNRS